VISIVVGIATIFLLPDNFETAWWLNEDEKIILRARHENERLYQGKSMTTNAMDKGEVKLAFLDPKVWLNSFCQFCANTCSFGFSTFLPGKMSIRIEVCQDGMLTAFDSHHPGLWIFQHPYSASNSACLYLGIGSLPCCRILF
jgi:hypothetical protein